MIAMCLSRARAVLTQTQQFIEINATGFRKILKKWDKRFKSQTKELYLARQVEVQRTYISTPARFWLSLTFTQRALIASL